MPLPIQAPYTAIISGGTGAIGRAIATKFASLVSSTSDPLFNVCIVSRDQTRGRNVAANLPCKGTKSIIQRHSYVHGQVTHPDFWAGFARLAEKASDNIGDSTLTDNEDGLFKGEWRRRGRLASPNTSASQYLSKTTNNDPLVLLDGPTVLVNAAGLVTRSSLARMEQDDIRDQVDANLFTTIWACKFMHRWMVTQGKKQLKEHNHVHEGYRVSSPCIVNISSIIGTQGGAGAAVYAATKGAVLSFSRALAEEYGRTGIRVNAVVPGMIDSPMALDGVEPQSLAQIQDFIPLQRFGTVEEVADAVAFLVGNDYANNCVLNIDGGMSAKSLAKG